MGITKTLWKVVRRPMTDWWINSGLWWLAGIVVFTFFRSITLSALSTANMYAQLNAINLLGATLGIIPLILFLLAVSACDRHVLQFYELHAAPMQRDVIWGRYLLALSQLVPIALVTIPASIVVEFRGAYKYRDPYWIVPNGFAEFSALAVTVIWLGLFIVLATRKPFLQYGIALAFLISEIINNLASSALTTNWNEFSFPVMLSHPEFLAIGFGAVPLWLILASALKHGSLRLANAIYLIIVFSVIGHLTFVKLYQELGGSFLRVVMIATKVVNSPIYFFPDRPVIKSTWLNEVFGSREFVCWAEALIAWMVPCILLGLVYLFVFSSYPKGWVEYWRGKLQSR